MHLIHFTNFNHSIIGVAYARYEGFNTLKSGINQLVKNEIPIYEIISGATLAFAALLLNFTRICHRFNWNIISYSIY